MKTALKIEYFDEFMKFRHSEFEYLNRDALVEKYAWAVPTPAAVETIAELGPIIEIGAGKGYWAKLIAEAGGDIVAYDNGKRGYTPDWFDVQVGSPRKIMKHPDRNLMLCWPEYHTQQASHAAQIFLSHSQAEHLIYIGEGDGGCTGTRYFHKILAKSFEEVEFITIPQWRGIHDVLAIYRKKSQ